MIRVDVGALAQPAMAPPDIESIYRNYNAAVTRWVARLAGPELETEDLVQEVFVIAHRKLGSFRGEAAVATWLYRIAERVVSHRRRRERLRRWLMLSETPAVAEVAGNEPTPLEVLQGQRAAGLIYRALEVLSEKHRAVFILFEIEELSGQQIAELTGVNVSTVWVWLHRARARFLARLAELEADGSS